MLGKCYTWFHKRKGKSMKTKYLVPVLMAVMALTACGNNKSEDKLGITDAEVVQEVVSSEATSDVASDLGTSDAAIDAVPTGMSSGADAEAEFEEIEWKKKSTTRGSQFMIPANFEDISPDVAAAGECIGFSNSDLNMSIEVGEVPGAQTPDGDATAAFKYDHDYYAEKLNVVSDNVIEDKEFKLKGESGDSIFSYYVRNQDDTIYQVTVIYPKESNDFELYEKIEEKVFDSYIISDK